MRCKIPFSWFGGKTTALNWLLPIINDTECSTFVDVFGGSGTVTWNKKPSPVDVYNDIHGDVTNFFRVLRRSPDELIRSLELTPYSREEFVDCLSTDIDDEVERARQFFVVARQVTRGLATTASPGRWCYTKTSRRGMSLVVSRWLSAIDYLNELAERLRTVLIENLDYRTILEKYDGDDALFYLDPPYHPDVRTGGKCYKYEFQESDHEELLSLASKLRGKALISGYECQLYGSALSGWNRYEADPKCIGSSRYHSAAVRQEILWANYDIGGK